MKFKTAWTPYIGIAAALLVPAFVAAQQFNEGSLLRAEDLRTLEQRIDALETNRGFSPVRTVSAFGASETGTKTFRANGDGIVTVRSTGNGFAAATVDMLIGGEIVARCRGGGSAATPLRSNEVLTVGSTTVFGGSVALFWSPLNGDSTLQLQP